MSRSLLCSTIILALGLALLCAVSSAADLKIAVVDIDKVSAQYKELTTRQAELGAWVEERKLYLTAVQDFMFVSAEEFQEAARIYQVKKSDWSADQTKREGELRKVSEGNEKKFLDLQAKPARSAEEQNQYNVLRDTYQGRDADLRKITAEFDKQLRDKRAEVETKLIASVRTVIEKVSQEKGYTLVIDKSAVYHVAAPVDDVTEEVLKALNASAPAAGAGNATTPEPPK